jgi:hypothetical protein
MRPDFSAARLRRLGGLNRRARLIAILAIVLSASSGAFAASTPYRDADAGPRADQRGNFR